MMMMMMMMIENQSTYKMSLLFLGPFFFFLIFSNLATSSEDAFTFNGFKGANLSLDGIASITSDGLLQLTNTTKQVMGHGFHPAPLYFRSPTGKTLSFSTTFVFGIIGEYMELDGHGIAFLISHTTNLSTATPNQYLGLFNPNNNGNSSNHILAIELDTIQNPEFQDIDNNHVGIDINGLKSIDSHTAGYYAGSVGQFTNLSLGSRQPMQVWIDFNGEDMQLNVTLSPIQMSKPSQPLLSSTINLSSIIFDSAYVGFSSATGSYSTSHYILGWSFKMNGEAEALNYKELPKLPRVESQGKSSHLAIWLPIASFFFLLPVIAATVFTVRRSRYAEILEDWEQEYGPHRFSYKDLLRATDGFKDQGLLGVGGFGRVYRGVLPTSNIEVAVKRVSHESKQGMKEFVAEIVSIGQIRHRNIVQLLGYCRLKGELLLVYSFMPNGSLDKFLYNRNQHVLEWHHRFRIIKGVASGLSYLHEEWEQVVIHRDIKASNVLLDSEMNGRLGDFGLARLYDHGTNPRATHIVGTIGYLAPELARSGKATTVTDVFAFGIFLLEVACGRRPLEAEHFVLVDWVLENWKEGSLMATIDPRLGEEYSPDEMEMVLKLGLLCSHRMPEVRPTMRQVVQILDGNMLMPDFSPTYMSFSIMSLTENEEFNDYIKSFPPSVATVSSLFVSGGR